ncbi:acyltransferase [Marinilongibacter aquaticus]|uniref:acyltransferase family protein n=1 Tax=Marinilongibacter aquaticus TaxID=2975157 RepID=UPI0021BD7042|nr:acyltransferase [Marinilongibacter aquaticus]UBM58579.1 acyltransferase [Marinilongibacter aquaticus]
MKSNSYIKSLDGLRFLAVTLVLADHWSGDRLGFPASYFGVCLFFVLSGFLITRILLKAKTNDQEANRGHGFSLRQFYIRRTIRIFPLYYLVLAVLFLLNTPPVREKIFWLATYMSNNYIAYNNSWLGIVDHLWSLAVEEQFYIFFPFIILFVPFKHIPKLLLGFVGIAVLLRAILFVQSGSWIPSYVLMPACLDAFGLGGLLAYFLFFEKEKALRVFRKGTGLYIGLLLYILCVVWINHVGEGHNYVSSIYLRLAESILSMGIIGFLVTQNKSTLHTLFEWNPLVYIGKISYGIYIYHNFVYNAYHQISWSPVVKLVHKLEQSSSLILSSTVFKIVVLYTLTVALSSLSWFLFEKPINQLKNKFGY